MDLLGFFDLSSLAYINIKDFEVRHVKEGANLRNFDVDCAAHERALKKGGKRGLTQHRTALQNIWIVFMKVRNKRYKEMMINSNPDFFAPAERHAFDRLRTRVHYTQYGGSCYAYGVLASGRTDLAIDGGLNTFDIFAPAAVIEGAGGFITDWTGSRFSLDWRGLVLASGDPELFNQALTLLQAATTDLDTPAK